MLQDLNAVLYPVFNPDPHVSDCAVSNGILNLMLSLRTRKGKWQIDKFRIVGLQALCTLILTENKKKLYT